MIKQTIAVIAAAPLLASSAFAAPYVESKTTAAAVDGNYKGSQTELRAGYDYQFSNKVTVYGEVGPGYEWTDAGNNQTVAVGEIGVTAPLDSQVSLKAKVFGEYGFDSEVFGLGGELKVRYTF